MEKGIGQVSPTHFVHRLYEESHVRIRLVSFSDQRDPDKIIGTAVETRVGNPNGVGECRHAAQLFGVTLAQFGYAADAYKKTLQDYVAKGFLA